MAQPISLNLLNFLFVFSDNLGVGGKQFAAMTFPSTRPFNKKAFWLTLSLAAAVRAVALWLQFDSLSNDPDGYRQLAETLATQGVFGFGTAGVAAHPTAFRPPGYPYLLSWLVADGKLSNGAVAGLHWLLGIATVALVYLFANRLLAKIEQQQEPRSVAITVAGCVAALIVACDPILLVQSTQVMTETLATLLAVLGGWAWFSFADSAKGQNIIETMPRKRGLTLGLCLLIGFFGRPISAVWAALLFSASAYCFRRRMMFATLTSVSMFVFGICLWTQRNIRAVGEPIWATSHGGYTLLLANNPMLYQHLREHPLGTYWDATRFLQTWDAREAGDIRDPGFWQVSHEPVPITRSEVEDNKLASEAAMATIRREPAMFVWSCVVRVWWLWSPCPQIGSIMQRSLVCIWYLAVYLGAIISLYRWRHIIFSSPWLAGWLLMFALTGTHAVYWSNLRMRAPAVPFIAIVAAASLLPRRIQEG